MAENKDTRTESQKIADEKAAIEGQMYRDALEKKDDELNPNSEMEMEILNIRDRTGTNKR